MKFAVSSSSVLLMLMGASADAAAQELRICTLIGCASRVFFPIEGLAQPMPNGRYRLEANVNGQLRGCEVMIPPPRGVDASCGSGGAPPWVSLSLVESLPAAEVHGTAPGYVEIRILRDGDLIGQVKASPGTFRVWQPNGPKCSPTCLGAGPFPIKVSGFGEAVTK